MKKIIVFILIVLLLPVMPAFANEVTANLPAFDVNMNGVKIENTNRQFPLIVYKDITYVPMTYYDCRYLGLTTDWNNETRTLCIEKSDITAAYRDYQWPWKNPEKSNVAICNFNIVVNGKTIDNSKEEYPLLLFRDVTYFPLTWRFAVDEFEWGYNFDSKSGLSINSDNYHTEILNLPNVSGGVATDGEYYYYNGNKDGKKVVYRAKVSDTISPELILELADTPLTRGASFINSGGNIYISYFTGYSNVTGTQQYYKIEADGSVTKETPTDNYSGGKHGYSELRIEKDGIKVKGVNQFIDGPTEFSYEIDGKTYEAEKLPGRVRVGRKRNGIAFTDTSMKSCVQIFKNKIYYTATDLDTTNDSALYCIDTLTGKNEKIIDGVCGFYVYNGWLNEENADSTMIIYDNKGHLMRYSELNGDKREIENNYSEEGLVLETAVGEIDIYTVQRTIGGNRTVVKVFSCYAAGNASVNGAVLLDTKTGTHVSRHNDKLSVAISGESPDDEIRLLVVGKGIKRFLSVDAISDGYIYDNILLYRIGENTIVKVNLRK